MSIKLPIYQIDAFANQAFEGNPAAVVPLLEWLSEDVMQSIAEENNLAETAFYVAEGNEYKIRWFTPKKEVELCGHATLASAFVIFNTPGFDGDVIEFESLSGVLSVTKENNLLTLDFPSQVPEVCQITDNILKGLGISNQSIECLKNKDYIVVLDSEEAVMSIVPDSGFLEKLDLRGIMVTSVSNKYDFVARFFAPKYGIPEDPVTGSAYTQLTPYWSEKLGKYRLNAKQLSSRGGELVCELVGERVLISGKAIKYLEGEIEI